MTGRKPGDGPAKTRSPEVKPLGDGGANSPFAAMQRYSQKNIEREAATSQYSPMYEPPGEFQFSSAKVLEAFVAASQRPPRNVLDEPQNLKGPNFTAQEIADTVPPIEPARALALFEVCLANSLRQLAAKQKP